MMQVLISQTSLWQRRINQLVQDDFNAILIIIASFVLRLICMGYSNLLVEETYYWNYAQHLDFSYLDHPPMVALLIKISTWFGGLSEFSVRIPALFCWSLTTYYMYRWTELICKSAGIYAVLALSVLPFFFIQSIIMTPDDPALMCWAASLYCFYQALVLHKKQAWYKAGAWLGIGMLSKYTIALVGLSALIYMVILPEARYWLKQKQPYLSVFLSLFLFTPVLYWNAQHEWASFVFQSVRRVSAPISYSFHYFIGLLILFLLPVGLWSLVNLFNKKTLRAVHLDFFTQRFFQIFTLVPLCVFGLFSIHHAPKFNWIGPGLLALMPWLALLLFHRKKLRDAFFIGALISLLCYVILIVIMSLGVPEPISRKIFQKYISWENLTEQLQGLAKKVEEKTHSVPIFIPLDTYNISSELSFYQVKHFRQDKSQMIYPIIGRHIFGSDSLMYRYWSTSETLTGRTLILVASNLKDFDLPSIRVQTKELLPRKTLWAKSQGNGAPMIPFYYEVVEML